MIRLLLAAALVAAPAATLAQDDAGGTPPQRIRNVTLAKGQPCPRSTADEVVVCQTIEEPYRIPKQLREEPKQDAPNTSWAVRSERVMNDNRKVLPGSCSPIGSNGHTGCAQQAAEAWAAEKRAAANPATPPQ